MENAQQMRTVSRKQETQTFYFNPLPDENIWDWSKLKEIADDI